MIRPATQIRSHMAMHMERLGLSLSDIHRATNINRVTLTQLYKGEQKAIRMDNLSLLCKLFGCDVGDLLSVEGETRNPKQKAKK